MKAAERDYASSISARAARHTASVTLLVLIAACQPILGITDTRLSTPDAAALCGDGNVTPPELCDDGNLNPADGCSPECRWEVVQVAAGGQQSCALGANGAVKCWGDNMFGELGLGDTRGRGIREGDMGVALPSAWLGDGEHKARRISVGHRHVCAVRDDDSIWCWGGNYNFVTNVGVALNFGQPPSDVVAGAYHGCAIVGSGALICWGYNGYGQLGVEDGRDRDPFTGTDADSMKAVDFGDAARVVGVAAGREHTCGIVEGGNVRCWGRNNVGQLGLGDTNNRGALPGELNWAVTTVDLGDLPAVAIVAGEYHTCAILEGGSVKCWGDNQYGQLGVGDLLNRGQASGEMGNALPAVALDGPAAALALGEAHTCVLLTNGHVRCWGDNQKGQLGQGDMETRMSPNVDTDSAVDLGTGVLARSIFAGTGHTCALLESRSVKCWGYNASGQLGLEHQFTRGDRPGQMGDKLPVVDLIL